jgi:hypothetical protein
MSKKKKKVEIQTEFNTEMFNSFKVKINPNYANFGSTSERFPKQKISENSIINEEIERKKKTKKIKENVHAFNSTSPKELLNTTSSVMDVPGPGNYELTARTLKQGYSNKSNYFCSSETRFKEKSQTNDFVGPGAYLKNTMVRFSGNPSTAFKTIGRNELFRPKNGSFPSIGQYSADIKQSMAYKVSKGLSKPTLVEVPFNIGTRRFIPKEHWHQIGPADYFKTFSKDEEKKINMTAPFNHSDLRFHNRGAEYVVGPLDYDTRKAWKKKSFNVKFNC